MAKKIRKKTKSKKLSLRPLGIDTALGAFMQVDPKCLKKTSKKVCPRKVGFVK